jgi:hypothetical protein
MRIIVLVAALGLAAACESGSSDPGKEPETSAPAGKVVDIEGTVRARPLQGEARVLVLGDEVRGAEIIETGADGSVQIALYHNDAQWFLGPDKQRQVSESEAWRLPRQPRQPLLAGTGEVDPTAAAGRQAERQAADTLATARAAVGEEGAAVADERAAPPEKAADDAADKAASTPVQRRVTRSRQPSTKKPEHERSPSSSDSSAPGTFMREQPAAEAPVTEDTEGGAAAADHGPPTGAAGKSAQRPASAPDSEGASLVAPVSPAIQLGATNLGKDADAAALRAVRAAIQKRLPRVVQCLGAHKPAERSAVVSFAITPAGRASSPEISVKDQVLRGCLTKHWRPLRIPGVAAGTKVEQTLLLVGF